MNGEQAIDPALTQAEQALDAGRGLKGTGFWKAVGVLRRDRALAERYADRASVIDRRAFEKGVKLRVPLVPGLIALVLITAFGVVAVLASFIFGWGETFRRSTQLYNAAREAPTAAVPISFLLGTGALLIGTHSLAHYVVGRMAGIRFTHVFLGGPPPPRPGVKTDYATYLRATPRARAIMHASGAVVTKLLPFALLPVSVWLYEDWPWLTWVLIAIGIFQIVTDVVLSTKVSDWKKVRREMRAARG
ncbi:MAG: hypothetical protein WD646_13930 [Actinomycetota bacterium]